MSATLTVKLPRAISSATVVSERSGGSGTAGRQTAKASETHTLEAELKSQVAAFARLNQALCQAAEKFNTFCRGAIAAHKGEIARLSVEIARKVLAQKLEDRDYKIEAIIKEVLESAPSQQDVVVHLNAEDFARYQELQASGSGAVPAGVKVVPDPNIGPAECLLESPKGAVESFIEQRLERVAQALRKAT